ncbi:MAG: FecR family protein, partial [Rhodocyclaceae bacterium]|nr:FecR family protein [Rhodocyclaceae bacterium]
QNRFATVIRPLVWLLLFACQGVWAAPVGQVTNLSGPLFALNAEGGKRILSIGSQVESGETLVTEGKTYAQVRFIDKGVVTLRPGTQFKIESFAFKAEEPEKDNAAFGLIKGALRKVTGLIGKRGNQDAYNMRTPTATIGIRGTQFLIQFVSEESTAISWVPYAMPLLASLDTRWIEASGGSILDMPAGLFSSSDHPALQLAQAPSLAPGTYLQVLEGFVNMSNAGGSQLFSAGEFGLAPLNVTIPPVILPSDPGIGRGFTPPPSFQTTQQQATQAPPGEQPPSQQQRQQQNDEDGCVVR